MSSEIGVLDLEVADHPDSEGNTSLQVLSFWTETFGCTTSVHLMLVEKQQIWQGKFNKDALEKKASENCLPYQEYCETMKCAFIDKQMPTNNRIIFQNSQLLWKRIIKESFLVVYGIFDLIKFEHADICPMMYSLLGWNTKLLKEESMLQEKNESLQEGWNAMKDVAENAVSEKLCMEENLYKRFTLLLNEKKKVIEKLKRHEYL